MTVRRMFLGSGLWLVLAGVVALGGCTQETVIDFDRAVMDAQTELIRAASNEKSAPTRAFAIEALAEMAGLSQAGLYMQALRDDSAGVRFAAAKAVGDLKYAPALARLKQMASSDREIGDSDKRVYCGVIYALHRLGNYEYAGQLGPLLKDRDPVVREYVVRVMGWIGDPSAIVHLEKTAASEQDPGVRLQIVEALARLGRAKERRSLEGWVWTNYLDERISAIEAMVRVRAPGVAAVCTRLMLNPLQPARARVAAAGALGQVGDADDYAHDLCLVAMQSPSDLLTDELLANSKEGDRYPLKDLQRLGAVGLGWMGRPQAVEHLLPMLKDPHGPVRVAAARSILRLLKDYRTAAPAEAPPVKPKATDDGPPSRRHRPKLGRADAKD